MKWTEKLKAWAKRLKRKVAAIFLAYRRKDTPLVAKIVALITVGYALSPIDLIPDFIPVLGYLDDLIILPILVAMCVRLIPPPIFAACEAEAEGMWAAGKPKRWYYSLPIVAIWLVIFTVILRKIL